MCWGYNVQIIQDDLTGAEIQTLLQSHLTEAYENSPADAVFALDLSELQTPEINFWTIWQDGELLGCGALKKLGGSHGEIKSMRTADHALGKGVASKMLIHIIEQAKLSGLERLSLETGENEAYAPARNLYEKFGFKTCGPFADYKENQFSIFMTLDL